MPYWPIPSEKPALLPAEVEAAIRERDANYRGGDPAKEANYPGYPTAHRDRRLLLRHIDALEAMLAEYKVG